ncbi:hypothetical protein [Hymenobacter canadensis]|uniref:Uncharacterized protein n=1 Tax=Hymenobacter canadensis TaxID=2999067 RepID=A0ABY7LW34_9BACT|nr:hypothetical protein [Hymenobacter canadensis]WBA44142.1 hypothetical protein O3303_19830 [Hymenobacter canadensis]
MRAVEPLSRQAATAHDELLALREWLRRQLTAVQPGIFYGLHKYYPAAWQLWLSHKNGCVLTYIQHNLRRGLRKDLFHPDLDVDIHSRLRLAQVALTFPDGARQCQCRRWRLDLRRRNAGGTMSSQWTTDGFSSHAGSVHALRGGRSLPGIAAASGGAAGRRFRRPVAHGLPLAGVQRGTGRH